MSWNQHSDRRYEATREDVLAAVGPVSEPDPFGHNQRPWTEFLLTSRIAETHGLPRPHGHLGRAVKRNKLQELLTEMVADGSIIGRPRKEWAAMGREYPSRATDIMYAHPDLAAAWAEADKEETS